MRTIVLTSLSLSGDLRHQLRCLSAWDDLGVTLRSANALRDCELLEEAGVPADMLLPIPPRETALDRAGAPKPRLVPLLQRIARAFPGHSLLLTAPGVFPALRDTECLDRWLDIAPALALTAEETPLLDTYHYSSTTPCRDRVDAFLLHPDRLPPLAEALERWPAAQEMCLNDSGWDLMLTATLASGEIGGTILDSSTLLRETLPAHAAPRPGLAPYVPALRALGLAEAPDPEGAAEDCAAAIAASSTRHARQAAQIKAFCFAPPAPEAEDDPAATALARELLALVPWVQWNYDIAVLRALIRRIKGPHPFGFDRINAVLTTGPSPDHQISEALLAMLIWCRCRPDAIARLQDDYRTAPALAQAHIESLHQLLAADEDETDPAALRRDLVHNAARDMIDHGIWPVSLQDTVALCCQNDMDRLLFDTLTHATRKVADAAHAA